MGLDFENIDIQDQPDTTSNFHYNNKKVFSQHCDALLHNFPLNPNPRCYFYFGTDSNLLEECRYLENLGYFKPGFYMVNPFYYLGDEYCDVSSMRYAAIKNGVLFRSIGCSEDLNNLQFDLEKPLDPEILESLPIVLFRGCDKPIGIDGVCNNWKDDLTQYLHCKQDTQEFIGVFKAERTESAKGNVYKMTKIFDRYYFNDDKILK